MTVKQMIDELKHFKPDQEVKICCYTTINNPEEMVIFDGAVDKNGNPFCQIHMDITYIGLEIDRKTVCIS